MTSTSISCQGDRRYVAMLKAVAAKQGITLAELVRRGLDQQYGDELEQVSEFFDANGVASEQRMMQEMEIKAVSK